MSVPYTPPSFKANTFNCPHCDTYADQSWLNIQIPVPSGGATHRDGSMVSSCRRCSKLTIWVDEVMVYPSVAVTPPPHSSMPESVKAIYEEASAVMGASPRSSAALLRLAIELLADHFGAEGEQVAQKVRWLVVNKGLDPEAAVALHTVHLVGNHSIHPGEIDLSGEDNRATVTSLFDAINYIVDELIARPAKREALWALIPEEERKRALEHDMKARAQAKQAGG